MGGIFEKAINPLGAVAPGLSPSKIAAKKLNMPFLDPSQFGKPPPAPQIVKARSRTALSPARQVATVGEQDATPTVRLLGN